MFNLVPTDFLPAVYVDMYVYILHNHLYVLYEYGEKYEEIHQVANFGFKGEEQRIRVLKYED